MPNQYENEYLQSPHQVHLFKPENSSLLALTKAAVSCHQYDRAFEIAFNSCLPTNPQSLKRIMGEPEYKDAYDQIIKVWLERTEDLLSPKDVRADKERIRGTYLETTQRILTFMSLIAQANPKLEWLVIYEPKADPINATVIPIKGISAFRLASQLAVAHTLHLIEGQKSVFPSAVADPSLPVRVETPEGLPPIIDESYAERLKRLDEFLPIVNKTELHHANRLPTRGSAK